MARPLPLLDHNLAEATAFSPKALVEAVRAQRNLKETSIPEVCVLEFDGDLTDWLVSARRARPFEGWACFHTTMFTLELDGTTCGIVPRTIGGPYAVLIAEQMAVSGARVVLGLTSAGQVSRSMPVPGLVVATSAVRDEGTSYHYLPPGAAIEGPKSVARLLKRELRKVSPRVLSGRVWTTDAPYRETASQLAGHARAGVLAVEMQAAALFAFSSARRFPVGVVAHVTNSLDTTDREFDKGSRRFEVEILRAMCRAGMSYLSSIRTKSMS
jgi:uridine phosphorylase